MDLQPQVHTKLYTTHSLSVFWKCVEIYRTTIACFNRIRDFYASTAVSACAGDSMDDWQ